MNIANIFQYHEVHKVSHSTYGHILYVRALVILNYPAKAIKASGIL